MSSYWEQKAQAYIPQGRSKGNSYGKRASSAPATPPPPLGPLIQSIRVSDLNDASTQYQDSATIQGCEAVASYSWLGTDLSKPEILIPGKPPLWTPPATAPQLEQDSGKFYRDRNAARYPNHPFEPAIATLLRTKPSLVPDLDIVACGSTLGNLLRFVRGQDKTFRFLVEKVGNTIFFIRRENSPREVIPDVKGYGHTFPERYTTWEEDAKGSWVNQRLITYQFGGLRFLVRFEADGYLSEDDLPKASPAPAAAVDEDKPTTASVDELMALFDNIDFSDLASIAEQFRDKPVKSGYRAKKSTKADTHLSDLTASSFSHPPTIPESSTPLPPLTIRTSGPDGPSPSPIVPQAQVFDLKTRSIKARENKNTLEEELPRLWVAQIPNFILAYHTRGKFFPNDIEIRDVRPDVQLWEKERTKDKTLAKLAAVVRKLVDIMGKLDEQWNGGKVKGVEGKGVVPLDGKSEEDSGEDDGEDDENISDKPATCIKTPTPIRIEVIHRFQNLDTLEIRHQGWKETNGDKNNTEGDGRDGVLSCTLRKEWIAAQTDTFTKKEEPE
ncbi:hypothetical protein GE21DRAFT_3698 [Neurospora crassa]|uniref:Geranylgeranyl pyrophosphate synthetase n=1 Tax=Neurospora crassa (strain ATCC 24698 / 74-OR23-1A / CBS 708.71 / DSM 1257 / FGSC 987) TaxID=367110 RepID=Q7S2N2_NEUCR|nr:hypothetical protein NCU09356 [Neurospora crassa OR74A]EAA29699.1 hypothetical protein NCU09356 [Neurospora crassa OR74A]KHE87245.1 hypothetical protein GE21DRAFT_3698 [Neurospora crassa]|eukprot:XP_958935.1 hypothetical protein NCU09356 [Neurospora crassa OR74A]